MKSKEVGFSTRTVKVPVQKPSNKLRRIGFRNSNAFCLSNSIFFITAIMLNLTFSFFAFDGFRILFRLHSESVDRQPTFERRRQRSQHDRHRRQPLCSFLRSTDGLQSKSNVSNGFQSATQPNTRNPSEIVFVSVGCSGKSARTPMIWQTSIKAKPHAKADNEAPMARFSSRLSFASRTLP